MLETESVLSANAVGLSNPHLSHGRRTLLDLINRLHSTGAQVDIDLPQIAVIGSQSAGKSSLIESISGVTLPRASGTCTRCPTECRLASSTGSWQCIVSLKFTKDIRGQTLGQPRIERFGDPISDRSLVEDRVRRAQQAILNPSTPLQNILDGDDQFEESALSFSMNSVMLDISGEGVADLSFCDLPGIIASSGSGGKAADIELVRNLVSSYIKKPSCLILLTVACETDFENQGAHELARLHDPNGVRTVGVLTKPDRIPSGEEEGWLAFIRNEKEPLENNWYCVKQPNSQALRQGVSWADARKQENDFFSLTRPWSDLDPTYQKYLRTSNLVERLSVILSDLISKRLPEIQDEIQTLLRKTEAQLASLPRPPSAEPFLEINNLLHDFSRDLSRWLEGIPQEEGLMQAIRPSHDRFRKAILGTAPDFRPYRRIDRGDHTPVKLAFLGNEVAEDELSGENPEEVSAIYVDDVMEQARIARTRELPGNYPFVVKQNLISRCTDKWKRPAETLCQEVYDMVSQHVRGIVSKHFSAYGQGTLEQRLKVILVDHVKQRSIKAQERIQWLLHLERRPFTLNTHYFADYRDKFFSLYKGERDRQRSGALMNAIQTHTSGQINGLQKVMEGLAEVGAHGILPADLPKILPPDEMEPALNIMADSRAYFQVAYKRFSDNIPLAIDAELVLGVEENLLSTIYSGLGIDGIDSAEVCKSLAQEHPAVASRREELKKKLERLNGANQELLHIKA